MLWILSRAIKLGNTANPMNQQIIVDTNIYDFKKKVQAELDNGWQIIPGTLSTTLCEAESRPTKERYVVFLQKAKE